VHRHGRIEAWLPEAAEAEGFALENSMILAAPDGSERRPWSALRPPLR
jgi:hypothetical protein